MVVRTCGVANDERYNVYKAYKGRQGIEAVYIKDYKVMHCSEAGQCDSTFVDVTLLKATDQAGWDTLGRELNVPAVPDALMPIIEMGQEVVSVRLSPKGHPDLCADSSSSDAEVVAIAYKEQSICVFHTLDKGQRDVVRKHCFDKIKEPGK